MPGRSGAACGRPAPAPPPGRVSGGAGGLHPGRSGAAAGGPPQLPSGPGVGGCRGAPLPLCLLPAEKFFTASSGRFGLGVGRGRQPRAWRERGLSTREGGGPSAAVCRGIHIQSAPPTALHLLRIPTGCVGAFTEGFRQVLVGLWCQTSSGGVRSSSRRRAWARGAGAPLRRGRPARRERRPAGPPRCCRRPGPRRGRRGGTWRRRVRREKERATTSPRTAAFCAGGRS